MSKLIKIIIATVIAPITLMTLAVIGHMIYNNIALSKFEKQLFEFPLLNGTQIVSKDSKVGVLLGSGNHCDFVATITLKSDLPLTKIATYYHKLKDTSGLKDNSRGIDVTQDSAKFITIKLWSYNEYSGLDPRCT